jgi:hypothetical protein
MRNLKNDIAGEENQSPGTRMNLSRRQVIGGLSTVALGLPLLTFLASRSNYAQAQTQRSAISFKPPPFPGLANLVCSEFAKSGEFFVSNSIFDLTANNPANTARLELFDSNGEGVYEYDWATDLIPPDLLSVERVERSGGQADPFNNLANDAMQRKGFLVVSQLTAKDNLGRTAVFALQLNAVSIERLVRQNLLRHMIFVPNSIDLRFEYTAPATETPIPSPTGTPTPSPTGTPTPSPTPSPRSESVTVPNVTVGSDLTHVLMDPFLFFEILNPTLFSEMAAPGLLPILAASQLSEVLAAASQSPTASPSPTTSPKPTASPSPTASPARRSCLACSLIVGGFALAAATLIFGGAVATGVVVIEGASTAGGIGGMLTGAGGMLASAATIVDDCRGACA